MMSIISSLVLNKYVVSRLVVVVQMETYSRILLNYFSIATVETSIYVSWH